MTAAKIIEEIKSLPANEQAKVVQFAYQLAKENIGIVRYIDDKTFEAAADEVFEKYDDLLRRLAK